MNRQDFVLHYVLHNNPKNEKQAIKLKDKAFIIFDSLNTPSENSLSFGKHKGLDITEVPKDYLKWLYNNRPLKKDRDDKLLCDELERRNIIKPFAKEDKEF